MEVTLKDIADRVWIPQELTIKFNKEEDFRIFARIMNSDRGVASYMDTLGYSREHTQKVLDKISNTTRKGK